MSSTSSSSKPDAVLRTRSEVVSQSLSSKSMSPVRTHRVCSSGQAGKTEEAKRNLKWRPGGGGGGGVTVSLRAGAETRIPRAGRGKENLRGGRGRGGVRHPAAQCRHRGSDQEDQEADQQSGEQGSEISRCRGETRA